MKRTIGLFVLAGSASPLAAAPLPDAVRAMIEDAIQSGDPQTTSAVIGVAKRTNPESIAEIDAMTNSYNREVAAQAKAKADAERERLASAGILSLWKGQVELGGSWSTGNTRTLGLYGATNLKRSGLNWEHLFTARIDYQETDKVPTTERAVAAWQPRYKISPSYYAFGLSQYEHDRFLGYDHRFTGGAGLGVVAVNSPKLRIEVDAGPVVRYTRFRDPAEPDETRIAGRGSIDAKWTPWSQVTLAQQLAIYGPGAHTTVTSTSSLETILFGPVKGRLSYNIQYERDAPIDQKSTDTVSRASLVYNF
ncbi:DUF481 domain-containing protein [Sphingomonas crocodyli]|uniref:DUF481 domain-containing protein n=1 Tax=Sphingomonas crocodyli TaxID=1979270 RepID=A0A437LVR6_9SPHN|nr:DUF481 domain-containing protein [Sphingomonas crocodyli]RVT89474.1 DUF481 domain-containing protein [Sphingomonas crocodyli]